MLLDICRELFQLGIDSYYVGGYVRDLYRGIKSQDIDICLVGVKNKQDVINVLSNPEFCNSVTEEVGNTFPVWIADVKGLGKVDFALARTERKLEGNRKQFEVSVENVSIEQDLERRDLTINSIAINCINNELVDPFGGVRDLLLHECNPTSEAFKEDSLRVLRAARFCSKFNLKPSKLLLDYCRELTPTDISNERVGMEVIKLFKDSDNPRMFFEFLDQVGWLGYYFQELKDLQGVPQSPLHHPEGDAYEHTLQCVNLASKDPLIRTVMLCHDFGKSVTTTEINGKIQALGHEEASIPMARAMMQRIKLFNHKTQDQICTLIGLHMIHTLVITEKRVRKTLRTLINNDLSYEQLQEVVKCDKFGRQPKTNHIKMIYPEIGLQRANELLDQGLMNPVVTGKLLSQYMPPSSYMGEFIKKALELQDRGVLTQENWVNVMKGAGYPLTNTIN